MRRSVHTKLPEDVWERVNRQVGKGRLFPTIMQFILVAVCKLLEEVEARSEPTRSSAEP